MAAAASLGASVQAAEQSALPLHAPAVGPVTPLGNAGFATLTPARLLDTRPTASTVDGLELGAGPLGPNGVLDLPVVGRGGVPTTGVDSVALHVTAVLQTQTTFVTVYPTGGTRPDTSNLNPIPGFVASNLVIVPVGAGGKVSLYNSAGSLQLIVDVVGWFPAGGDLTTLTPTRIADTRPGAKVAAGQSLAVQVAGAAGVPSSGVSAVVLNVTTTSATLPTFLTVFPSGGAVPDTSSLNTQLGNTAANLVVTPMGADGKVSIRNDSGAVHVIVDVVGWFAEGPAYNAVSPTRLADTRGTSPLPANSSTTFQLTGVAGVPSEGVGSVVFNLTAVNQTQRTYLTVYPSGSPRPVASSLNPHPGVTAPNLVIAKVGPDGAVKIYNEMGTVDVILDVVGWLPSNIVAGDDVLTVTEDDPATTIDVLANDTDLDGFDLKIQSVSQPDHGTAAVAGDGLSVTYRPDADYCNTPSGPEDTFVYTLFGGATGDVSVVVTCVDDPPLAVDDDATITEDDPATSIAVLANDDDVDGGPESIASVTQPDGGTVVITGGGTGLTYQPDPDFCSIPATAADEFDYTVNGGSTATVSVIVDCVDDLPIAFGDAATRVEDSSAASINVLANDTDVDGGPKSIVSVTQPAGGVVVITGGGAGLTFAPSANVCNDSTPQTFTYTLNGGSSATVSVTVTCVDDDPVAVDDSATVTEDSSANAIDVLANDTDVDGGPTTISTTTDGAHGTVVITGGGTGVTYLPNADYCNTNVGGDDTFTYTLNGGSVGTVSVTVECVNDVPSFTKGADQTLLEDAGSQTVTGWATALSKGPANESSQNLTFSVSSDNPGLFSTAPAVAADGTLTYTPAANASGTTIVTVILSDSGGTSGGGVDTSASQTFNITITSVNDVPSFTKGADQTVLEDSGAAAVTGWATAISAGPADESGQTLTFAVTGNSKPSLFSAAPAVSATGELSYTPAADANGSATITLRVSDNGGVANGGVDTSATQTFTITVTAVNDAPGFDLPASPDQNVLEDSSEQTVPGFATNFSTGPANESGQTLTAHISNDNNDLFASQPTIDLLTGDLVYTPAPGEIGTAEVSFYVTDNGGTANGGVDTSATTTFNITVFPPNFAPTADDASPSVAEDTPTVITLTGSDDDDDDLTFNIVAGPSHGTLGAISSPDCSAANTCSATVTYTPDANYFGTDSFTFEVNDGTADSNTATVQIAVGAINDAPSFVGGANQTVNEDAGAQSVPVWATAISSGPPNESAQTVSFVVTNNSDSSLFAVQPAVSSAGTLTFTPAANKSGSSTITLKIADNGGTLGGGIDESATQSFTITVNPVNDAPSFTVGGNQTVLEDASAVTVNPFATGISAGPADESAQTITFGVTANSNASLFVAGPAVSPTGVLTFTPAPNMVGTATITIAATDSGGTTNGGVNTSAGQSFTITVTPVNDAPSFTEGVDPTVLEDSGAASFGAWATGVSAGPADESGQTVTFEVTINSNPTLFSVQPAVAANGTLTFTPAANANGAADITLRIVDNGGTANGGVDTGAPQEFTINVTAVNDAPSFNTLAGNPAAVNEDAAGQTVPGFATGMSAGPANESGQTFSFVVTDNTKPGLFSAQPAISPTGVLTYTPEANQHGTAVVTIKLQDNGGGLNDSATQQFTITVNAVNDVPTSPGFGPTSVQTNMRRSLVAGEGLLVGASDVDDEDGNGSYTPTFSVGTVNGVSPVSGTITTTIGGVGTVVANAATGAFTIDPAPGVTGPVQFNFTICDTGDGLPATQCSATAVAQINIVGPVIWFVDPSSGTNGVGTLASPFNVLSSADAVDLANHRIFVFNGTTTTGLTMLSGEWLIGQSATHVSNTFDGLFGLAAVPPNTMARPTIGTGTTTIGGTVTLNANAKVQGVAISTTTAAGLVGTGPVAGISVTETSVTTTTGTAVNLSSAAGTYNLTSVTTNGAANGIILDTLGSSDVSVTSGAIVGASTRGIDINSGTGNFSYGGTITTSSGGRSVEVTSHGGGTVAFTGSINDTGLGINLSSNAGATFSFSGGVTVSSGANNAFNATGGGTVTVTGSSNTLTTTSGTALNVVSTTIGANDLTFRSISAGTGAGTPANGIVLNTTGSSGELIVTGNGGICTAANTAGCSGGEIRNTTGADDSGVAPAGTGIVLRDTKAPSLTRMWLHDNSNYAIRGTAVVGFTLANSVINGVNGTNDLDPFNDASVAFSGLTGTANVTSTAISGGYADNFRVENASGTLDRLTFTSDTIGDNDATNGNDAVQLESSGSATFKVTVANSVFTGARGDLLQYSHGGTGPGDLVLTSNNFSNNHAGIATGGGGLTLINTGTSGATTMTIDNNDFRDAVGPGVLIVKQTGASTQVGTFTGNRIGVNGAANSGSAEGSALKLQTVGGGSLTWAVTNNTIREYNNFGVEVTAGGGGVPQGGAVNTTITGNFITQAGNTAGSITLPKNGIHLNIGTVAGDTYTACADIGGAGVLANSISTAGKDGVPTTGGDVDFRLRQRQSTTIRLRGYAGTAMDVAAVNAFIVAQNAGDGPPVGTSSVSSPPGGGFTGGAQPCV